nr:kunitz-type elastase inhibitor BrEI-like [Ipomoea trifida]
MKTPIIFLLLLSISFLPLAISGLPPLIRFPTKAAVTDVILDTAGNPVVAGAKYYAIPNLNTTGNPSACPTDVVINITLAGNQPPAAGRPITFYPLKREAEASRAAATAEIIMQQYPLNVAFDTPDPSDPCAKENVWKLEATIVTGGVIGKEDDIGNWFRIQKNFIGRGIRYFRIGTVGDGYQLGINFNDESLYAFEFVKAE